MTVSNFAFTPANGLRDAATYPTTPANEAAARAQMQDPSDQLKDFINTALIPAVNTATPGYTPVNKAGDTMTGNLEIANASPIITFTETDNSNKKWLIVEDGGNLSFRENDLATERVAFASGGSIVYGGTAMPKTRNNAGALEYFDTVSSTWKGVGVDPSAFANSKAASGYQKIQGGLIIQWATVANAPVAPTFTTVTFPIAFPTACVACVASNDLSNIYVKTITATNVQMSCGSSGTNNTTYIAIGY